MASTRKIQKDLEHAELTIGAHIEDTKQSLAGICKSTDDHLERLINYVIQYNGAIMDELIDTRQNIKEIRREMGKMYGLMFTTIFTCVGLIVMILLSQ